MPLRESLRIIRGISGADFALRAESKGINMKTFALFMVTLATRCCYAQDYPRFELSAGYSYGSVDTQGYGTQREAQGWNGSFISNLRRFVGVEAEANGSYDALTYDFQNTSLTANSRYYTFLLGPRFAYRKGKTVPFVHALFGVDRAPAYDNTVYDPLSATATTPYVTGLASAIGGGFDYAISHRLAFRTEADYLFTRHAALISPTANNFRVQASIVFTFGQRESLNARRRTSEPVLAQLPVPSPSQPAIAAPVEAAQIQMTANDTTSVSNTTVQSANPIPQTPPVVPEMPLAKAYAASPADVPTAAGTVVAAPSVATTTERPVSKAVSQQPTATQATAVVASNSQSVGPNSVIISQSTEQYQTTSRAEEPLGDVARRYREKKHGTGGGSGF
jgi:hypothetical protein